MWRGDDLGNLAPGSRDPFILLNSKPKADVITTRPQQHDWDKSIPNG